MSGELSYVPGRVVLPSSREDEEGKRMKKQTVGRDSKSCLRSEHRIKRRERDRAMRCATRSPKASHPRVTLQPKGPTSPTTTLGPSCVRPLGQTRACCQVQTPSSPVTCRRRAGWLLISLWPWLPCPAPQQGPQERQAPSKRRGAAHGLTGWRRCNIGPTAQPASLSRRSARRPWREPPIPVGGGG
jgi:hypothetical protein